MFIARVVNYFPQKAYGFLRAEGEHEGIADTFFHLKDYVYGVRPEVGALVSFEVIERPDGRHKAVNIDLIEE